MPEVQIIGKPRVRGVHHCYDLQSDDRECWIRVVPAVRKTDEGPRRGTIVPVKAVSGESEWPPQPLPGYSRSFVFDVHGVGWGQFLVRDCDPDQHSNYFRERADEVELVAQSGKWRLYRHRR